VSLSNYFAPRKTESGFTLLEVLIAMVLTGLLAIPLAMFSIRGLQSYQFLQSESNTSTELSTLTEQMAKVIRGTTSVITAQSNTLTVYAYFDPDDTTVKQVRYFVSGNKLEVGVTPPSGTAPNYTFPSANEVVTTLYSNLVMGSTPMFTYYDNTNTQLPNGFTTSEVNQVGIYVAANPAPNQETVPIALTTRVTLRNFKTNL
jgi:prepilin-type N-terminal cleavage/methylation domain-containing protein